MLLAMAHPITLVVPTSNLASASPLIEVPIAIPVLYMALETSMEQETLRRCWVTASWKPHPHRRALTSLR